MTFFGWIALSLLAALGGAGVTIFGTLGLEGINPALATALRAVILALVMVAVALGTGQLGALVGTGPTSAGGPSCSWQGSAARAPGWRTSRRCGWGRPPESPPSTA